MSRIPPRPCPRSRLSALLALCILGAPGGAVAGAQCRVGGQWFAYDSPQCRGDALAPPAAPGANPANPGELPPLPAPPPPAGANVVLSHKEVRNLIFTTKTLINFALAKGQGCEAALARAEGREACAEFVKFVAEQLTPWQQRCLAIPVGGMTQAGVSKGDLQEISRDSKKLKALLDKVHEYGIPTR